MADEPVSRILRVGPSYLQVARNQQAFSVNRVSNVMADTDHCTFFAQSTAKDSDAACVDPEAILKRELVP